MHRLIFPTLVVAGLLLGLGIGIAGTAVPPSSAGLSSR